MERDSKGEFSLSGRTINFKAIDGLTFSWHCRTEKEAKEHLAMFRRSVEVVSHA